MTIIGQIVLDLFLKSLDSTRPHSNKRVISIREADILRKVYNFEEDSFPNYVTIASEYSITCERIRQIHNRSLMRIGSAGRKLKGEVPCVHFLQFLINFIEESAGENKYSKIGNFWKENLSDFPDKIVVRLIANLTFSTKKQIDDNLKSYKDWINSEFEKEKLLKSHESNELRKAERVNKIQDEILSKVVWFEKRSNGLM
jgi:hypothetical protein